MGAQTHKSASSGENSEHASSACRALVDWLEGTFPVSHDLSDIKYLFGDTWVDQLKPTHTHNTMLRWRDVKLLLDPRDISNGIRFVVTGNGCRQLEWEGKVKDWCTFLDTLLERGAHLSRLDVAIDDRAAVSSEGILFIEDIKVAVAEGRAVSRYKETLDQEKKRLKNGESKGISIMFGDRESDTSIRIYDKAKQMSKPDLHWTRCELETHKCKAQELAKVLAMSHSLDTVADYIYGLLDFKVRGNSKCERKELWKTAPWWSAFLGTVRKARLHTEPSTPNLESTILYIERVFPRLLAVYFHYHGSDIDALMRLVHMGELKLTPQDRAYL